MKSLAVNIKRMILFSRKIVKFFHASAWQRWYNPFGEIVPGTITMLLATWQ